MPTLLHRGSRDNPRGCTTFFDKVVLRLGRKFSGKQMRFLAENANSVDLRYGRPIPGLPFRLTLVNPNEAALRFLARQRNVLVNNVEVAFDIFAPDTEIAHKLSDVFDRQFVQPWHGKSDANAQEHGTYTKANRPGLRYVWYWDRPSKDAGGPCLHVEARAHGADAVRRLGIDHPIELLTFDHGAFWMRRLSIFEVDLERLGRWHENRRRGSRRQTASAIIQSCPLRYSVDRARGAAIYRFYATTDAFARFAECTVAQPSDPEVEVQPERRIIDRSLQKFVDRYGRGPFMRRLGLCYLRQSQMLLDHPDNRPELHIDADVLRALIGNRFDHAKCSRGHEVKGEITSTQNNG